MSKPRIRVVSAAIVRGDKYLITQRSSGAVLPLLWEFPGGRVEDGETDEGALVRELEHRLGLSAAVGNRISQTEREYEVLAGQEPRERRIEPAFRARRGEASGHRTQEAEHGEPELASVAGNQMQKLPRATECEQRIAEEDDRDRDESEPAIFDPRRGEHQSTPHREHEQENLITGFYYRPFTNLGDTSLSIDTGQLPADLKAVFDVTTGAGAEQILLSVEGIRPLIRS